MMRGFWNALVGAIVGVLATTIVGGGIAYFTDLRNAVSDYAVSRGAHYVIDHLQVSLRDGDPKPSELGLLFARCLKGEIVVGGGCRAAQHARLRGQGTTSAGGYYCDYVVEDDYKLAGVATAACMSAK